MRLGGPGGTHEIGSAAELREGIAHHLNHHIHQLAEEARLGAQALSNIIATS